MRYAALAAGLAAIGPAFAGRPLRAEDAGVLEPASCEAEGGNLHLTAFDEHRRDLSLQLACGLGASTQLGVAGSHSIATSHIDAFDPQLAR